MGCAASREDEEKDKTWINHNAVCPSSNQNSRVLVLKTQKQSFLSPLYCEITPNKNPFHGFPHPPKLIEEFTYLYHIGYITIDDYVFLVQGYIIIKTAQSALNVRLGRSDSMRREVLMRSAINALEGSRRCCSHCPCINLQLRKIVLFGEENWVRWATECFPCVSYDVAEPENVTEGEMTLAADHLSKMKHELALKHRILKVQQKRQYKRDLVQWRLNSERKLVPLSVAQDDLSEVMPLEEGDSLTSDGSRRKKKQKIEMIRRKLELIKVKNDDIFLRLDTNTDYSSSNSDCNLSEIESPNDSGLRE